MNKPAYAIAWEFRQRHRWGLLALAVYLIVLATIRLLIMKPGQRVDFDSDTSFALAVVVPISTTFLYFLSVFTYGLSGDIAARQSMYPARMFTLPVTTTALVGWPMLYGSCAVALLWLATRLLAVWPSGVVIPVVWPALLAASLLAWTQALTWMPYPLPFLRVIVTVMWLAAIDAVVMLALYFQTAEPVMLVILAPHLPLAFLVARFAVARARLGAVPDWLALRAPFRSLAGVRSERQRPFASSVRAQAWFEWRRHGRSLPVWVAILLPFELSLFFVFRQTPPIVVEILISALLTPPLMAAFAAATVSKSNPGGNDSYDLTPFLATRPLTSPALVAAKLRATIASTLAAWMLVLVAIPLALFLSGTSALVLDGARRIASAWGTPRAVAMLLLGITGLMAATWKQLVQSLFIGMSGRAGLVKASVFVALSILTVSPVLVQWILNNHFVMSVLWNALPWIAFLLAGCKLFAAAWVAIRLRDRGLFSDRTIILSAACWDVLVFALYALLAWMLPALLVRRSLLVLLAVLEIPLARLAAIPLALNWNRHR